VPARRGSAFTLIELLTVITILAILATLLLTSVSYVKRKAREALCISNLHQTAIALHLYLDDAGDRPPSLATLVTNKYLGDGRILTCAADRTRPAIFSSDGTALPAVLSNAPPPAVHISYQTPLDWPQDQWDRLMRLSTRAGVVACTFHDISAPKQDATIAGILPGGLILRGQLDGTVLRRQVYPLADTAASPPAGRAAATPVTTFAGSSAGPVSLSPSAAPWEFFSDDPPP